MEQQTIKPLARLIKKERKVAKQLRQALKSQDMEKVPELSAKHRELTGKIHALLPPPVEP
ncbi:MAG: hypothetical protein OEM84_08280 [Acidimicrobiia bacterium]|nr:hypothetical protein [Acidimicrobiia bacterium]